VTTHPSIATDGDKPSRLISATLMGIVVAAAAIAIAQSWNRWFDPIVDAGRDLYISEQLARGARLYRDIRYEYPPFAPYLLAGIVRVIGSSLSVFAGVGIAQSIATAALLFAGARQLAGRWGTFAIVLTFVSLNFAGATTFGSNYVIPYSYAATVGMLFLLLFFVCAIRTDSEPVWLRAVAIAAALAASWCKLEYAVAVAITMAALAYSRRLRLTDVMAFIAAAVLTIIGACAYFGGTAWLREDVFAASLTRGAAARRFFSLVAGTANWPARVVDVAIGAAAVFALTLLLRDRRTRWVAVLVAITVGVLIPVNSFFRAWALLQWIALVWAIARDRRDVLLPLAALSIASTLRIPLNVAPWWYGFVLVVPTYLLIAYVLFSYLPSRGLYERNAAAVWVIVFAAFAVRGLADQHLRYSVKQFPVPTIRGTFYDANADRAAVLADVLPRLRGDTLSVVPEGIGLNYLAAARTPLTWHTFIPPETADPRVEDLIIRELDRHPPHRIAWVRRSLAEFGYRGFGVDYDERLAAWIRTHYRVEQAWLRPQFQLVLFRRAQ
jgi:hypothetical protein